MQEAYQFLLSRSHSFNYLENARSARNIKCRYVSLYNLYLKHSSFFWVFRNTGSKLWKMRRSSSKASGPRLTKIGTLLAIARFLS